MSVVSPEELHYRSNQYFFEHHLLTSQTQLFMLGKEKRGVDNYRLNGLTRHNNNHYLLQYTLSGCGILRVGDRIHRITPGTAMLLNFPDDNEYYTDPETGTWEFIYIMVQGHHMEQIWKEAMRSLGHHPRFRRNDPLIQLLCKQIKQAQDEGIPDAFEASRIAYAFSMELARASTGKMTDTYPALVVKAIDHLNANYATLQGVDQLADDLGVSKSHLIREFSKSTGLSPGKYLLHIRMRQAVVLLQKSELNLDEIARQVGYDNGNYFSKVFYGYYRVRPSSYREDPLNAFARISW